MEDLLGIISLLAIALLVQLLSARHPELSKILWTALLLRAGFSLINYYIFPLPDSQKDAVSFEALATSLSSQYGKDIFFNMSFGDSHLISWVIGTLYTYTGHSPLMAQNLSVMLGTISVYFVYQLAFSIWGHIPAIKSAWLTAFFPTLILYSALTLREAYIVFFLLLALLGASYWAKTSKIKYLILSGFGFFVATLFHGAMIIGAISLYAIFL